MSVLNENKIFNSYLESLQLVHISWLVHAYIFCSYWKCANAAKIQLNFFILLLVAYMFFQHSVTASGSHNVTTLHLL